MNASKVAAPTSPLEREAMRIVHRIVVSALSVWIALAGSAFAKTISGSPIVNFGDAYLATCTAASSKCMSVDVCDALADADFWQLVVTPYAPSGLLGHMENNHAQNGTCTTAQVCRAGTTVGPIKSIISVIHVSGTNGHVYDVDVTCLDKNFILIDESKTTLKRTTTNN
jgi:hypothetical protein